jgi:hypothetical protein
MFSDSGYFYLPQHMKNMILVISKPCGLKTTVGLYYYNSSPKHGIMGGEADKLSACYPIQ